MTQTVDNGYTMCVEINRWRLALLDLLNDLETFKVRVSEIEITMVTRGLVGCSERIGSGPRLESVARIPNSV